MLYAAQPVGFQALSQDVLVTTTSLASHHQQLCCHLVGSRFVSKAAITNIATLGPALRSLVLHDIGLSSARGLELAIGSLPHLQVLAVQYAGDHGHTDDTPDVLDLVGAAAQHCASLVALSLRAKRCRQHAIRGVNGHHELGALSALTQLSCLELQSAAVGRWPAQLSVPARLAHLSIVDGHWDCSEDDGWVPEAERNAQPLPQLATLRSSGQWGLDALLSSSLTKLALEMRHPWWTKTLNPLTAGDAKAAGQLDAQRWLPHA